MVEIDLKLQVYYHPSLLSDPVDSKLSMIQELKFPDVVLNWNEIVYVGISVNAKLNTLRLC